MELWIRSQNKEILAKIINFSVVEYKDEFRIVGFSADEMDESDLGNYKTKERALEVLDEIQSILNLKDMYKYDRELVLKSWENVDEKKVKIVRQQMSVYEMPEE